MNAEPLSECMYWGIPNSVKSWHKQLIKVDEVMSGQAKAKGNREYSSITVSKYLLAEREGIGPLKSMLKRSNGCVALMSVPGLSL